MSKAGKMKDKRKDMYDIGKNEPFLKSLEQKNAP